MTLHSPQKSKPMATVQAERIVLEGGKLIIIPQNGEIGAARDIARKYAGKPVTIEVKQEKNRRSLSANAYAWVLLNKIATAVSLPVVEVYRDVIRSVPDVSDILRMRSDTVSAFRRLWESRGLGWQAQTIGEEAGGWVSVIYWYGSSSYDVRQMSVFIEAIKQECRQLGIETWSDDKLALLMQEWGEEHQRETVQPEG